MGFPKGTFTKKFLDEIMSKVDLKEAKHGPFVHISHFQDLNEVNPLVCNNVNEYEMTHEFFVVKKMYMDLFYLRIGNRD
jgi:hypothetical protein